MTCRCKGSKTVGAVEQEIRALDRAKTELHAVPRLLTETYYRHPISTPVGDHIDELLDASRRSLLCRLGELTAKERGL